METAVNGATSMKYVLDVLFVGSMVINFDKNRENDVDAVASMKLFYDYNNKNKD